MRAGDCNISLVRSFHGFPLSDFPIKVRSADKPSLNLTYPSKRKTVNTKMQKL